MRRKTQTDGIRVKGHTGTWYIIDTMISMYYGFTGVFHLLESEQYGDAAAHIIIDDDGNLILDEVYNGFDDLREFWGI